MAENRDFAWLRKTLCDEIEAVRNGTADHNRAKSVTGLAIAALKSVEVEAMLRQQQGDLGDTAPALGSLPLCAAPALLEEHEPEEPDPQDEEPSTDAPQDHAITDVSGFKVNDRVMCPNGKRGTIKKVTTAGRIEVAEDGGGTSPYSKRQLEHLTKPITSPVVPQGPLFVPGRDASGSR